jgi:hypothetical protein
MALKTQKKRFTIFFDPDMHQALRVKAAETGQSISELVNQAVKLVLDEDAEDLAAFEERQHEPDLSFDDVLQALKRQGKI